jgi:hypothetical protein
MNKLCQNKEGREKPMSKKIVKIKGCVIHQAKYTGSIPLSVITKAVDQVTGSMAGHSLNVVERRNKRWQLHRGSKQKK